jgi:hypothetical protein
MSVWSLCTSDTVCYCFILESQVFHLQHDHVFAFLPSVYSTVTISALILTHHFLFSFIFLGSSFLFIQNHVLIPFIFPHVPRLEYTLLCSAFPRSFPVVFIEFSWLNQCQYWKYRSSTEIYDVRTVLRVSQFKQQQLQAVRFWLFKVFQTFQPDSINKLTGAFVFESGKEARSIKFASPVWQLPHGFNITMLHADQISPNFKLFHLIWKDLW